MSGKTAEICKTPQGSMNMDNSIFTIDLISEDLELKRTTLLEVY